MKLIGTLAACVLIQAVDAQTLKRPDDVLFKQYLVRSLDFHEKANRQIFGNGNPLVKTLLEAYCAGVLKGYTSANLTTPLTYGGYEEKLALLPMAVGEDLPWEGLHLMEIGEHLIFDKHTSDFYFSMESLTIHIPAELSHRGLQEPLVSFSYKDCVKIFRSDKSAVSFNPLKNGRDINYADLFLLRCFNSVIVKTGNRDNPYFDQTHSTQMAAFLAAKEEENKLTGYLYKLYHPE